MYYVLAADLVVLVHFTFILYAVFGGLFVLKWPKTLWLHGLALGWGVWVEFSGRICPLTPLENWLRRQAQQKSYQGDFVEHYLVPLIYPESLQRSDQIAMGGVLLLVNLVIYGVVIYRLKRR